MSSELFIKDSALVGSNAARPQTHDARFPERKPIRTFHRFAMASPDQDDQGPVVVQGISFPFQISTVQRNVQRPRSSPGPHGGQSRGMASSGITDGTGNPNQAKQTIRQRLRDWFTQYPSTPDIQVKQHSHASSKDFGHGPSGSIPHVSMLNDYQLINNNVDLSTLVDRQVCFVERSRQKDLVEQIVRTPGTIFTDTIFDASWLSVSGEYPWDPTWNRLSWGRMTNNPSSAIFQGNIEPTDIQQGAIGDCYFLAAIAALAQRPQRIRDIFLTTTINSSKVFACKIMYKGKWKEIYVDDMVPCFGQKSAFSQSIKNEMWVELLEKSWAKLYSSYKRIDAGFPEEGLHDLTGAHIKAFRLQNEQVNYQKVWNYLLEATNKGYSVVGSTLPGSDQNIPASGVVLGHAYTILGAYNVNAQGQMVQMVNCRNPWGKIESNFAWSDRDPNWNVVSPQERERIGFNPNVNDGSFFIGFGDFCSQFRMITSAEVDDSASYAFHTLSARDSHKKFFKIEIFAEGDYSFQINQIPERRYPDNIKEYYNYVPITFNLGRVVSAGRLEHYPGSQSAYRTLFSKHHLKPGAYIASVEIQFDPRWQTDYEITLGVYGTSICRISQASSEQSNNFYERLFLDRAYKTRKPITEGVFYNQQILPEGYIYAACFNSSQRPVTFRFQLLQNMNTGIVLLDKDIPPNFDKVVQPNGSFIALARIPNVGHTTSALCNIFFMG